MGKGVINDTSVIYADIYDKNRQKAIKDKVEKKIRINGDQLIIEDYYVTSKGGNIAWVKTDPRLVQEIHRRAQKSALKDFRTTIFVPKALGTKIVVRKSLSADFCARLWISWTNLGSVFTQAMFPPFEVT